jgi:hypothetical protein
MDADAPEEVLPEGRERLNGKVWMRDGKGALWPVEMVKTQHLLEDELVRRLHAKAELASKILADLKLECFVEIATYEQLLAEVYKTKLGGAKGNKTLATYDATRRIQVQISDLTSFGPELQAAKALFDECLNEWSAESRPELRSLVTRAFSTDKEGLVNRSLLFMLLRTESEDERWSRACEAIKDSIRVDGSKEYIRFHHRPAANANWDHLALDIAAV